MQEREEGLAMDWKLSGLWLRLAAARQGNEAR